MEIKTFAEESNFFDRIPYANCPKKNNFERLLGVFGDTLQIVVKPSHFSRLQISFLVTWNFPYEKYQDNAKCHETKSHWNLALKGI